MHQRKGIFFATERFKHFIGGNRGSHPERAPRERFSNADNIGNKVRLLAGKHRTGSTESGGYFIRDKQ